MKDSYVQGVVYLGTEWSTNPVVRSDIVVSHFLDSVGGYRHRARRDKLLRILDVDLDWCVLGGPSTGSALRAGTCIRWIRPDTGYRPIDGRSQMASGDGSNCVWG